MIILKLLDKNGLTEEEFLQAYAKKSYPRPYLTVDVVTIMEKDHKNYVLLIRRGQHPYLGKWALPGGFAKQSEDLEQSALREIEEETGIRAAELIPVGIFSRPGRDPRGWVVSQAYATFFSKHDVTVHGGDDAAEAKWFQIEHIRDNSALHLTSDSEQITIPLQDKLHDPSNNNHNGLAFDHDEILMRALSVYHTTLNA